MTAKKKLASRYLTATAKVTHGRSNVDAQEEARNSRMHLRNFLSADPEVLELARDGVDAFVPRTAQRIMAAHSDELHINRCPRCGKVARTRERGCADSADMTGTSADLFA
jgi:hypothetical protein